MALKWKRYKPRKTVRKTKVSKAVKKYVHKVINRDLETKYHGALWGSFSLGTANVWQDLTLIPQGTTVGTRLGSVVDLKHVRVRVIATPASGQTTCGYYRTVMFKWRPDNDSQVPIPSDIFRSVATPTIKLCSGYNTDNQAQVQILYDKVLKIDPLRISQTYTFTINKFDKTLSKCYFNNSSLGGTDHIYMTLFYVDMFNDTITTNTNVYFEVAYKDA